MSTFFEKYVSQSSLNKLNTGTIYLGKIDHVLKDSEIGNIAKIYNIPDFKAYIAVMLPIAEEPFLQAGGSHVVLGMEYGNHKWGFQISFGYSVKHRTLSNGIWQDWMQTAFNTETTNQYTKIGRIVTISFSFTMNRAYAGYETIAEFSFPVPNSGIYAFIGGVIPENGNVLHAFVNPYGYLVVKEDIPKGSVVSFAGSYMSAQ